MKKIAAYFISIIMIFTMIPIAAFADDVNQNSEEKVVTYSANKQAAGLNGEGTKSSPYLISSYDDLKLVKNNPDAYYKQMKNIDLDYEWTMLFSNTRKPFTGVYDGNGKTISNMPAKCASIFGQNNGVIKDLTVKNVKTVKSGITSFGAFATKNTGTISNCHVNTITVNGKTSSGSYEGGICGTNYGLVENCSVKNGSIKGIIVGGIAGENRGSIKGCYSNVSITAHIVGGIVAENLSLTTISKCEYGGKIVLLGKYAGGIAGSSFYTNVNDCKMTGTIQSSKGYDKQCIGGIIGEWKADAGEIDDYYADIYLKNCTVESDFTLNSTKFSTARFGGMVGKLNVQDDICVTIDNCTYNGNAKMLVTGTGYMGGIVGSLSNPIENTVNIQNCVVKGTLEKIPSTKHTYTIIAGGIAGYSETVKIYKCKSSMTVEGNYVGCIVGSGQDELVIDTCLATGITNPVTTSTARILPPLVEPVYAASNSGTAVGRVAGVFNGNKIKNTYFKASKASVKAVGKKKSGSVYTTKYSKFSFAKTNVTLKKGKNTKIALNRSDSLKKKTISYTSNNKKVATVNKDGRIYAKGVGTTYIKATIGGILTTSIKVTVKK